VVRAVTAPRGLLEAVVALAGQASERILEVYATEFDVERKSDRTLVTNADVAAHDVIADGLQRLEPGVPMISEEDEIPSFDERSRWSEYWLVDPLDGTRGFVARNGEFTVNIALVSGHRPILGVVAVPVRDTAYLAAAGAGAHKDHRDGTRERIRTRRCSKAELTVTRSRSRRSPRVDAFVEGLAPARVIRAGSSLKPCLIAEGTADVYLALGPTSEWDTAAAQCVLEEAGGALVDLDLAPLRYNDDPSVENPSFVAFGDPRYDWRRHLSGAHA